MPASNGSPHSRPPRRSTSPLRAFGRAMGGLFASVVLIFFAIKLLPWRYVMEARIGPMYVDERTWALVEQLQEARYVDGTLHGEFLELVVDVLAYPPIGLAVLLMGLVAVVLTIRRR